MSQRYQKEIEEILEQANVDASEGKEQSGRAKSHEKDHPKPARKSRVSRGSLFTPGRLLIAGVVLLVLALALSSLGWMPYLAWTGIGLIIASYVVYFTKPRRTIERRWRGQLIEDEPEPNPWQRLWRWITRG